MPAAVSGWPMMVVGAGVGRVLFQGLGLSARFCRKCFARRCFSAVERLVLTAHGACGPRCPCVREV